MNYQHVVATRQVPGNKVLPPEVQERRVLQSCLMLALSAIMLFVLFPSLRAQDVYTKANLPKIGLQYTRSWAPNLFVDPQSGGLDQTWDFSSLQSVPGKRDTIRHVDATGLTGSIPAKTNVAVLNSGDNSRLFYNTTKPSLKFLGADDDVKQILMGSDPFDIDPIPVKFGAQLSSVFKSTILYPKQPAKTIHRQSIVRFSPDGTGKVLLPGWSIDLPAIRVHWSEDHVDTVLLNNKPSYRAHTVTERYVWYDANSPVEYLSISQSAVSFSKIAQAPPADSQIVEIRFVGDKDLASGVADLDQAGMEVYPMPASSILHIKGIPASAGVARASLYSMTGELLSTVNREAGNGLPFDLRTDNISAQSAILEVEYGGRRYAKKIVIAR